MSLSDAGRIVIRSVFLIPFVGLLSAACGSNPVAPSQSALPAGGSTSASQASVASVLPSTLPPSGAEQTLFVSGANFKPGLTVTFTSTASTNSLHGGPPTSFGGSAISELTDSSFQVRVTIPTNGHYTLSVTNPESTPSGPVSVNAEPSPSTAPTVVGMSPKSPTAASATQGVYVLGTNFQAGLKVLLTSSGGNTSTIDGSAIYFGTATAFKMWAVLAEGGAYSLRVVNPSGDSSESWNFTVKGVEPPTTPPTTPQPPGDETPSISGISPSAPTVNPSAQQVYVGGVHFANGLSVSLKRSNGESITLDGSAITFGSATAFKMSVVLADAGGYAMRVTNPSGKASDWFTFTVKMPEVPQAPTVTSIQPASPSASTAAQGVYVFGTNFATGLSVQLTRPNGETSTIGGTAIYFGSATVFKMNVVLGAAGPYSLKVANPSGLVSNAWAFTVQTPEPPTPSISGTSPRYPIQNTAPQKVYVGGVGFEAGLTVQLTSPGGSTTTLDPSAVTFGSSTAFSINVILAELGDWVMRVTNPSGKMSEPKVFTVKSLEVPTPAITSISPSAIVVGTAGQGVYVFGTGFESGLTVLLTRPNGETSTISGSPIYFGSSTVFKVNLLLNAAGGYSLKVVNPSGKTSEAWTFTVNASGS
jgi:hypothetical protein